MSEKSATERPIFSFRDVVYIMTLVIGFAIQHFTIKQQIHDTAIEVMYSKKETTQSIALLDKRVDTHERRINWLSSQVGSAIKPKELQIEPE